MWCSECLEKRYFGNFVFGMLSEKAGLATSRINVLVAIVEKANIHVFVGPVNTLSGLFRHVHAIVLLLKHRAFASECLEAF